MLYRIRGRLKRLLAGGSKPDRLRGFRRLCRLRRARAPLPHDAPPAAVRSGLARCGGRLEHRSLPGVAPHAAPRRSDPRRAGGRRRRGDRGRARRAGRPRCPRGRHGGVRVPRDQHHRRLRRSRRERRLPRLRPPHALPLGGARLHVGLAGRDHSPRRHRHPLAARDPRAPLSLPHLRAGDRDRDGLGHLPRDRRGRAAKPRGRLPPSREPIATWPSTRTSSSSPRILPAASPTSTPPSPTTWARGPTRSSGAR